MAFVAQNRKIDRFTAVLANSSLVSVPASSTETDPKETIAIVSGICPNFRFKPAVFAASLPHDRVMLVTTGRVS